MKNALVTYLQDHLAGATFGTDLLENCLKSHPQTPLATSLSDLLEEIAEDRRVCLDLLARAGGKPSRSKEVSSWMAEKVSRLKLDGEGKDLGRLEELEMLLLGIRGKLALWVSLEQIQPLDERLRGTDFRALQERALRQLERVEAHRIDAARRALDPKAGKGESTGRLGRTGAA